MRDEGGRGEWCRLSGHETTCGCLRLMPLCLPAPHRLRISVRSSLPLLSHTCAHPPLLLSCRCSGRSKWPHHRGCGHHQWAAAVPGQRHHGHSSPGLCTACVGARHHQARCLQCSGRCCGCTVGRHSSAAWHCRRVDGRGTSTASWCGGAVRALCACCAHATFSPVHHVLHVVLPCLPCAHPGVYVCMPAALISTSALLTYSPCCSCSRFALLALLSCLAAPNLAALGDSPLRIAMGLAGIVPIILNCYVGHQSVHGIMAVLQPYSADTMKSVCAGALGLGAVLFMALGLGGVTAFGPATSANILVNMSAAGMAPLLGTGPAQVWCSQRCSQTAHGPG